MNDKNILLIFINLKFFSLNSYRYMSSYNDSTVSVIINIAISWALLRFWVIQAINWQCLIFMQGSEDLNGL